MSLKRKVIILEDGLCSDRGFDADEFLLEIASLVLPHLLALYDTNNIMKEARQDHEFSPRMWSSEKWFTVSIHRVRFIV